MGDQGDRPSHLYQSPDKDLYFLGRNLSEFPCFRSSLLTGLCTGIGSGLGYFLYSSRPAHSSHVGLGMLIVSTLGYWTVCRFNFMKSKLDVIDAEQKWSEQLEVKKLDVEARRKEMEEHRKKS